MVWDILDMRLNKWVLRWEEMKVKMINEIYVEVEVKLGLWLGMMVLWNGRVVMLGFMLGLGGMMLGMLGMFGMVGMLGVLGGMFGVLGGMGGGLMMGSFMGLRLEVDGWEMVSMGRRSRKESMGVLLMLGSGGFGGVGGLMGGGMLGVMGY